MKRGRGRGQSGSARKRGRGRRLQNGDRDSSLACSPTPSSTRHIRTRNQGKAVPRKYQCMIQTSSESEGDDSDYSVESISSRSTEISHLSTESYYQNYRIKTFDFIELPEVRPLVLPPSSDDLLVPNEHVMSALAVYEVLRHFGRIIRLSPFRFEDFTAALISAEKSVLLDQIHLNLVRACITEDEANGFSFAAHDEKESINLFLYFLDSFTWPEVVRCYLTSNPELRETTRCCNDGSYPMVSLGSKIQVLCRLTEQFLSSNAVREEVLNDGMFQSEDHCRNCGKMGDLLCCESCPAVFHLHCLKPALEEVPQGDWLCPICKADKVQGVTDCDLAGERLPSCRNTPLGIDRQGRKYWFLVRRIFV